MPQLFIFIIIVISTFQSFAQSPCNNPATSNCVDAIAGTSEFIRSTSGNIDFTFDNMSKYVGGITYSGSTVLRLKVDELVAGSCKWKLIMYIDNKGHLPNNEWEPLTTYGGSGDIPSLELIEANVYNGCGTPINNGTFRTFSENAGDAYDPANINNAIQYDILEIIPDLLVRNMPGSCDGTPVNGPGSYLTDYNEYNFTVDYRIKPKYSFKPGMYQIVIWFCLVEVP